MKSTIFKDQSFIFILGDDATSFLQGLITSDIKKTIKSPIYSMMLSPQGRFLFDFFISSCEEGYLIEIHPVYKAEFLKKLKLYKLNSKVDIIDKSDEFTLVISSREMADAEFSFIDPRVLGSKDIIYRSYLAFRNSGQISIKDSEYYYKYKYNNALIDGFSDLIQNKSFPQEYGLDYLGAIDYDKGCYVGQEVVSRTKYQGVVRKKIFKVTAEEELIGILQDTEITDQNKKAIGKICSSYKNLAIALIKTDELKETHQNYYINDLPVTITLPEWYKNK